MILVTGGAGFIGANFVLEWHRTREEPIVNLDALTYAGNAENLASIKGSPRHLFINGDIGDFEKVSMLLGKHRPRAIVNLAAETHVDRSIHGPDAFMQTNVMGICRLLEASRTYWEGLPTQERAEFRFLHVSTDEVYGTLGNDDPPFTETTPYAPNSPYAASKAASDHLVRAWYRTYGFPAVTTNCSNNYGPFQFPEKLIPLIVHNALNGEALPIYGNGRNVRDWIYVLDHCAAIRQVLESGRVGETYNIGGRSEMTNLEVVNLICSILDEAQPRSAGGSYRELITFVTDRPGHDHRYAIDGGKIERELGWTPTESFLTGIRKTIHWYLKNGHWMEHVTNGVYRQWISKHYTR
jgi:dTDP-glucose 4,6-dehydratase